MRQVRSRSTATTVMSWSVRRSLVVAEFEADLIRARTREGMAVAKAKGKLRGKQPKLSRSQEAHLVSLHRAGAHATSEIAELFGVARSTGSTAIVCAHLTLTV
jgi:DNA invertase Pin-like site-specific DNA recombinase